MGLYSRWCSEIDLRQSDSDRHIKMQILACALLAILSLPFSLCGMLRGKELERWPWGWIFKWPPDFPTDKQQPGSHLHSSLSPFTAHQHSATEVQLSTGPLGELPTPTVSQHWNTKLPLTALCIGKKSFSEKFGQSRGHEELIIRITQLITHCWVLVSLFVEVNDFEKNWRAFCLTHQLTLNIIRT